MSCLSWNCRGLGNPQTVRELHHLVKNKNPRFIFLIETKCKREKVEAIRNKIGYDCSFVIDSKGLSGGIALMWKNDVEAVLESYTRHHISLRISDPLLGEDWILIGFYGHFKTDRRRESWQLLRALNPLSGVAWLCVGDFNESLILRWKPSEQQWKTVTLTT